MLLVIYSQETKAQFKNNISMQVMPLVKSETNSATGLYIAYDRQLSNSWFLNFGYGMLYDNFWQSDEFDLKKHPNFMPVELKPNNLPEPQPFFIPDKSVVKDVTQSGFKNFNLYDSDRIDHFININVGYNIKRTKKSSLSSSIGLIVGIADRTFSVKADSLTFAGDLNTEHPFVPLNLNFWVVHQIRSRYLYLGYNYKVNYDYYFNEKISLGLSLASNVSLRKNFRKEQDFYFIGVNSKVHF